MSSDESGAGEKHDLWYSARSVNGYVLCKTKLALVRQGAAGRVNRDPRAGERNVEWKMIAYPRRHNSACGTNSPHSSTPDLAESLSH